MGQHAFTEQLPLSECHNRQLYAITCDFIGSLAQTVHATQIFQKHTIASADPLILKASTSFCRLHTCIAQLSCKPAFRLQRAAVQVQQAVRRAGAQLATDPRACFIRKASDSSRLRSQAAAGEALLQLAKLAGQGLMADAEAFLEALERALRGFLKRPGSSAATRSRQHSTYATHAHVLRYVNPDKMSCWGCCENL